MKKWIKIFLITSGILLLVLISFVFGLFYEKQQILVEKADQIAKFSNVDTSVFWQAWDKIHQNFIDKDQLNDKDLIYGAIKGLTRATNDPYTAFMTPKETKDFQEMMKGEYEGIGVEIGFKDDQVTIITTFPKTPAEKAGLLSGDKILAVNGKPISSLSLDQVASLIKGKKGSKVKLTIMRKNWKESKDIEVERATIKIPTMKVEYLDSEICHISIYQFSDPLIEDFKKESLEILKSPAKKIILDLRNNGGGYLNIVENIAGYFLKKGNIILIEDYGKNGQKDYHYSKGNGEFSSYPIVVLINNGSASGAEILAGALRDNRNIKLIGEKSFGKGSVQEPIILKDGSLLKVTIARWLTPKGYSISKKGLEPDIEVKMTEEDYKKNKDPQLEKAIEILKNL